MLYVAHLAFHSPDPECDHGYLTTLIEADSIDAAVAATRGHLLRVEEHHALFRPGTEITVASCVEIRKPARDGFVMQFWRLKGADFTEISTTLPDADDVEAVAYQWGTGASSGPAPLVRVASPETATGPPAGTHSGPS